VTTYSVRKKLVQVYTEQYNNLCIGAIGSYYV